MPRALLSVSDKTGLAAFARRLTERGFDLVASGGTRRTLQDAGLAVRSIEDLTSFPEILGGRVKTLHPAVHGGILARADQRGELAGHGILPFDLVAVNLYPFRETVARGAPQEEALEQIDIGGVALVRAAAKNHPSVLVVTDPEDYERVALALAASPASDGSGGLVDGAGNELSALRLELARKAFAHTAAYDAAIARWLGRDTVHGDPVLDDPVLDDTVLDDAVPGDEALPERLTLTLERREVLRYGENPHQGGARYREPGLPSCWDAARQHKGLPLSFLNLFDAEAAWRLVHRLEGCACVIVKHANPCGAAFGSSPLEAYERAYGADPKSAFGGVVAFNRPLDAPSAERLMGNAKADLLLAPGYEQAALETLMSKRRAMRVLELPPPGAPGLELRRIDGGFLAQEPDLPMLERERWQVVTKLRPNEAQWHDLELAWLVCAYTSSNAIVLVKDRRTVGVGAGQQSRVDAAELAARKADGRAWGGACASDAFYPFRDGLDAAAAAGVAAVIQPGGSVNDDEIIRAANEHRIAMVFTGQRHFKH